MYPSIYQVLTTVYEPHEASALTHGQCARDSDGDETSSPGALGPQPQVYDVAGGGVNVRNRVRPSVVKFLVQGVLRAEVVEFLGLSFHRSGTKECRG